MVTCFTTRFSFFIIVFLRVVSSSSSGNMLKLGNGCFIWTVIKETSIQKRFFAIWTLLCLATKIKCIKVVLTIKYTIMIGNTCRIMKFTGTF